MRMKKHWKKISDTQYAFSVDGIEVGTMEKKPNSKRTKAIIRIGTEEFSIFRTGFWRETIELANAEGETIANVYPRKWYASSYLLDYEGQSYKVILRNNPLAEWVILRDEKEYLAYGLDAQPGKGAINVKISTSEENHKPLLDFLLWYLFLPIADESTSDDVSFLLLVAQ